MHSPASVWATASRPLKSTPKSTTSESIDNINLASAVAATATLADAAYLKTSLESTKASKAIVVAALKELGIKYLDTQANFIYHEVKGSNADYQKAMAAENIFVGRTLRPLTTGAA